MHVALIGETSFGLSDVKKTRVRHEGGRAPFNLIMQQEASSVRPSIVFAMQRQGTHAPLTMNMFLLPDGG